LIVIIVVAVIVILLIALFFTSRLRRLWGMPRGQIFADLYSL
jgi:hypothetical protein